MKINEKWNIENSINFWKSNIIEDFPFRVVNQNQITNLKNSTKTDHTKENHNENKVTDNHEKKEEHHKKEETHSKSDNHKKEENHSNEKKVQNEKIDHFHKNETQNISEISHNITDHNEESNQVKDLIKEDKSTTKEVIIKAKEEKLSEDTDGEPQLSNPLTPRNDKVQTFDKTIMENMMNNVKDIKKTMEYNTKFHMFSEMMKSHELAQKELRDELLDKVKSIQETEKNIINISNKIDLTYKSDIKNIISTINSLERSTQNTFERINNIEIKSIQDDIIDDQNKLNPDNLMKIILEEDCNNRKSCNTCVENTGCVWCGIKRKCTPGDSTGPKDHSCMMSFVHLTCPSISCDMITDCKSCIKNRGCGWCKSKNKCMEGNAKNKKTGMCSNGLILYNESNDKLKKKLLSC